MCKSDDEKWADIGCYILIFGTFSILAAAPIGAFCNYKSKIQERNYYVERGYEQKNDNGKVVWIKSKSNQDVNVLPE